MLAPSPTRALRSTQFALEDSYYFSSVTITPGERDPATLTVPITIHAQRIKRDRYAASVGFGTDTGPRGQFAWDRRLVNEEQTQDAPTRYLRQALAQSEILGTYDLEVVAGPNRTARTAKTR